MKIGVSGTGRIGRLYIRKALTERTKGLELKVINTTTSLETLAHLLQYDSIHGKWDAEILTHNDQLVINGQPIHIVSQRDPALLPWREYGIDVAIDATGKFNNREGLQKHLSAGAKRVIATAPAKDVDLTIVMGVNEDRYDPNRHQLLSAASCTTNCLAPLLHVMNEAFGVRSGWMTSIHSYTNDQNHMDNPHKDLRRARSCVNSIIPTTTGVSKALIDVLPGLAPHIHGQSVRVPTQDVSLLDIQLVLRREVTAADIKEAFQSAISGKMGKVLAYNELPLVSSDYIGNEKSAIVDGLSTMVRGDQVKLMAWYDNEWAYACRVVELTIYVAENESSHSRGESQCLTMTV